MKMKCQQLSADFIVFLAVFNPSCFYWIRHTFLLL